MVCDVFSSHCAYSLLKPFAAFEKKTDITSALNVATRKNLTGLVSELQGKLDSIGQDVSHTFVKESKEEHLESKNLKAELHSLAMRRLLRARESSTELVISILTLWANGKSTSFNSIAVGSFPHQPDTLILRVATEEESSAAAELGSLKEAKTLLESLVTNEDAGLFFNSC